MGRLWEQFRGNYGRRGPEGEKCTPKVACRHRIAYVMHIISLCVRPKGIINRKYTFFYGTLLVQDGPEEAKRRSSEPGHFGVRLVPLGGWFGVILGTFGITFG